MRMAPNFVETLRLWIPAAGKTGDPLEGEKNTFHMHAKAHLGTHRCMNAYA